MIISSKVHFTGENTLLYPAGSGVALVSVMFILIWRAILMTMLRIKRICIYYNVVSTSNSYIVYCSVKRGFHPYKVNCELWLFLGGDQGTEPKPCILGQQGFSPSSSFNENIIMFMTFTIIHMLFTISPITLTHFHILQFYLTSVLLKNYLCTQLGPQQLKNTSFLPRENYLRAQRLKDMLSRESESQR